MEQHKIVVVEDERIVAMALEDQLQRAGYAVVGNVGSGEEAVDVVIETEPDLVLMDIRLAGELDGLQAAERIAEFSSAGVIFLTAYSNDELVQQARTARPYGYLLKPVADHALKPAIEMALVRRAAEQEQMSALMASLDNVLAEIQPLVGRLSLHREPPVVCEVCQKAKAPDGDWQPLLTLLEAQFNLRFPRARCNDC